MTKDRERNPDKEKPGDRPDPTEYKTKRYRTPKDKEEDPLKGM